MKTSLILCLLLHFFSAIAASSLNAIYRTNNLQLVEKHSPLKIKELSKSVAMIINKDQVFGYFIQTSILSDPSGINLCSDEKFSKINSVSACTGFLVAPELLLTAGHCFENAGDCENKYIAFDILQSTSGKDGHELRESNVYTCKEIVNIDSSDDVALIRLDRKAVDRRALKLRSSGVPTINEKVVMLGHPLGMPLTLSRVARVRDLSDPTYFRADLDSFVGNSGSPVFNQETFEVEGVLTSGQEDFWADKENHCNRFKTYNYNSGVQSGEAVSRINNIIDFFKADLHSQVIHN
jgi:V8-like Glu-specific endopeptidase